MYLTIVEAGSLRPELVPYTQGTTKIKDLVKLKSQLTSNFLTETGNLQFKAEEVVSSFINKHVTCK